MYQNETIDPKDSACDGDIFKPMPAVLSAKPVPDNRLNQPQSNVAETTIQFGVMGPLLVPAISLLIFLIESFMSSSFEPQKALGFAFLVTVGSFIIGFIPALLAGFLYASLMQNLPLQKPGSDTTQSIQKCLYGLLSGAIPGLPLALIIPIMGSNNDLQAFIANSILWCLFCAVHGLICACIVPVKSRDKSGHPAQEADNVSK